MKYSSGPASVNGQGYTAAPDESGTLCGHCHDGGAFGTPLAILSVMDDMGMPVTSYTPGETYEISLVVNAEMGTPSGYGFQLTVLDENNTDMANFSNPSGNTKISNAANVSSGRIYAEQNSLSVSNEFTFDWEAPSSGTGELTFYYNVNVVDGTGGTGGDNGGFGYSTAMSESLPKVRVIGELEINNAYTLPSEDGDANQVLTTDGSGIVSWMDAPSAFAGNTTTSNNFNKSTSIPTDISTNKTELDNLKGEVIFLKSEIEALKKMIDKLTEK